MKGKRETKKIMGSSKFTFKVISYYYFFKNKDNF